MLHAEQLADPCKNHLVNMAVVLLRQAVQARNVHNATVGRFLLVLPALPAALEQ